MLTAWMCLAMHCIQCQTEQYYEVKCAMHLPPPLHQQPPVQFFVSPTQEAVGGGSFCTFNVVILFRPTLYTYSVMQSNQDGQAWYPGMKIAYYAQYMKIKYVCIFIMIISEYICFSYIWYKMLSSYLIFILTLSKTMSPKKCLR